jgi:hypothetical protein
MSRVASFGQLAVSIFSPISEPETVIAKRPHFNRDGSLHFHRSCDSGVTSILIMLLRERRRVAKLQYAGDIFLRLPIRGMDEYAPDRRSRS